MSIAEIMTHPVTTLGLDDPISLAGAHFESGGFHYLPVVNCEKKVLGIVSDRDYFELRRSLPSEDATDDLRQKVRTIMSPGPMTTQLTTSIGETAQRLIDNNFSSILVIDDNGVLRGIVTWKDLVKFMARFPHLDMRNGELFCTVN